MSIAEKLTTIAENEQRVFDAGKTAEWSDIWDGIQNVENGIAVWYNFFCSRNRFIVDNGTEQKWVFKPKHDIKPTNSESMFRELNFKRSEGSILYPNLKVDLSQWLKDLGVTLDLSNCGNIANMFYGAYLFTRLPRLDLSACTTMNYVFHYNNIKVIDEIISSETTNWLDTTFGGSFPLEHCIFKGVIAKPFNLSRQSKLDHESLLSVLNCLKDFSGTTTKYTMTFGTTNLAKLTDAEKAIATQKGWTLT